MGVVSVKFRDFGVALVRCVGGTSLRCCCRGRVLVDMITIHALNRRRLALRDSGWCATDSGSWSTDVVTGCSHWANAGAVYTHPPAILQMHTPARTS